MDTEKIKEQARAEKRTETLTIRLTATEKAAFQNYCDINDYDSSSLLRALMHEFLLSEQQNNNNKDTKKTEKEEIIFDYDLT